MTKPILPTTIKDHNGVQVSLFAEAKTTIVSFSKPFDFIFIPKDAPPMAQFGERSEYNFLMNGSFFDGTRLDAQHAGWLKILGKEIAPLKPDAQLTHVVVYSSRNRKMEFIEFDKFLPDASDDTIEFQAGPVLISENQITNSFMQNSINGMREHIRTLIGYSNDLMTHFIIVRRKITLLTAAEKLLQLSLFNDKSISVINLDGEPSTALWARTFPEFNYNEQERLPLLLGVK
ncbi:MAG: phosphodiester glycosidase family protein [Calditrichaeota bacterium]|nr:phosphodiester glycosidase family protein [Calditrichota bacterium]